MSPCDPSKLDIKFYSNIQLNRVLRKYSARPERALSIGRRRDRESADTPLSSETIIDGR
jgi:hypothetical protein